MKRGVVHNGVEYELRGALIGGTFRAAVFHKNQRITGDALMSFDNTVDFLGGRGLDFLFQCLTEMIQNGTIRA